MGMSGVSISAPGALSFTFHLWSDLRDVKMKTLGVIIFVGGLLITIFTGLEPVVGKGIAVVGGTLLILSGKNSMAS
jgi:hypothetical protein